MNEPVTFPQPVQQMMGSRYPHHRTREICRVGPLFFILTQAEIEAVVKQISFYGAKRCETELIRA